MFNASSLRYTSLMALFIVIATSIPVAAGEKDHSSKPDTSPALTEESLIPVSHATISNWLQTLATCATTPPMSTPRAQADLPPIADPQRGSHTKQSKDPDQKSECEVTIFSDIWMECPGCSTHNLCDPFAKLCATAQEARLKRVYSDLLQSEKMPIEPVCLLVNRSTNQTIGFFATLRYFTRFMPTSPIFIEYRFHFAQPTPHIQVYQVSGGLITPPTPLVFPSETLEQIRKQLDEKSKRLTAPTIMTHDRSGAATDATTLYMEAQLKKYQTAWIAAGA